jgi:hypothetical protein
VGSQIRGTQEWTSLSLCHARAQISALPEISFVSAFSHVYAARTHPEVLVDSARDAGIGTLSATHRLVDQDLDYVQSKIQGSPPYETPSRQRLSFGRTATITYPCFGSAMIWRFTFFCDILFLVFSHILNVILTT